MTDLLFVHIDTTSNAVLTKGIGHSDFVDGIVHQPKNILLLDPSAEPGTFEPHTGLKILRGSAEVNDFFLGKKTPSSAKKWIDFSDLSMVKELTPLEISELLYFGHMKTHLRSPFFYKLQNNYVYFDLGNQASRVYYRFLDEFYHILSTRITKIVLEKANERRTFFRKPTSIDPMNNVRLKDLRPILQEGAIFCFQQSTFENQKYTIPIYLAEDNEWKKREIRIKEQDPIATLTYSAETRNWDLEIEKDYLSLNFR